MTDPLERDICQRESRRYLTRTTMLVYFVAVMLLGWYPWNFLLIFALPLIRGLYSADKVSLGDVRSKTS